MDQKTYRKTPMGKYIAQRMRARQRGISWELTFEEWWDIWNKSGKWEQRGKTMDSYVMSRKNDTGPYSKENVFIQTHWANTIENRKSRGIFKKPKKDISTVRLNAWDYPHENLDRVLTHKG